MDNLSELAATADLLKSNNEIKGFNKNEAQQYAIKVSNSYRKLVESLFDEENGILVSMQRQNKNKNKNKNIY